MASRSFERPWNDAQLLRHVGAGAPVPGQRRGPRGVGRVRRRRPGRVRPVWIPLHDNTSKIHTESTSTRTVAGPARLRARRAGRGRRPVALAQRDHRRPARPGRLDPGAPLPPVRREARLRGGQPGLDAQPAAAGPDRTPRRAAELARPRWAGRYELATYLDGVPEHLQQSLCEASNLVDAEAPTGDIDFEPESLDPQRYQASSSWSATRAPTGYHRGGRPDHRPGRRLHRPGHRRRLQRSVWQWGTLVRVEHRGHRLGLAVKVENLRRMQAEHPTREFVVTGNADANEWMVAINETLGFRVRRSARCTSAGSDPGKEAPQPLRRREPLGVEDPQPSDHADPGDDPEPDDDGDLGPSSSSKWWWSGAILKTRRPVSLKLATWITTDRVIRTKSPPSTASSSSVRVRIASPARAARGRAIPCRP